ncbi:hypothetical protein CVIRNUC_008972 [Coccomyxa viridis]|uniref:Protein YIPF n=1 Tax=Coccomyxa viridis TaxID=1274662 RepID=A0AAV1IEG7_9CHLO|nr:hypothetical protein CVIRNUC_008972 [Coccomyxa viridis]
MAEWQLAYDNTVTHRSGPPSNNSGVEWYNTGSASDFPAPSGSDYSYNAMPGYNMAGASASFEDEQPLLEELGIDLQGILKRSIAILMHRLRSKSLMDLDMGGPLLFTTLLSAVHLLTGKLHFGVVLGWSVVGSAAVWFVVSNLAGPGAHHQGGPPGIYDCCCLLGYCMLPMLAHALLSILVPKGALTVGSAALAVLWSGVTAAKLFSRRSQMLEEHMYLIMYPCLLMYSAFALLTIY